MRMPAVVRLSRSFWDDTRNVSADEKLQFVLRKLTVLTVQCRINTLELTHGGMKGQDTERLAGVLVQCPALAQIDLLFIIADKAISGAIFISAKVGQGD